MKILVLDDDVKRHKRFRQQWIGHELTIVVTAKEAIENLSRKTWDIVFLDHDLNNEAFVPSGPGTGYEVAQWLTNNPLRKPMLIVIHSFNSVGAIEMNLLLVEAVVFPGAWEREVVAWEREFQERKNFWESHRT